MGTTEAAPISHYWTECPDCWGLGYYADDDRDGRDAPEVMCPMCGGTGRVVVEADDD